MNTGLIWDRKTSFAVKMPGHQRKKGKHGKGNSEAGDLANERHAGRLDVPLDARPANDHEDAGYVQGQVAGGYKRSIIVEESPKES